MKAAIAVQVKRYDPGTKDAHGNVGGHADPEDVYVYAVAPSSSTEPAPDRDAVVTVLTIYAPPSVVLDPRDLVVVNGEDYDVVGDTADFNRGPFAFAPGNTFALQKASG